MGRKKLLPYCNLSSLIQFKRPFKSYCWVLYLFCDLYVAAIRHCDPFSLYIILTPPLDVRVKL